MIRTYLKERRSWILFFITIQLLSLIIGYIDSAGSFRSVQYYVFLSTIIFIVFITVRYHKESRFYLSLEERDNDFDVSSIPEPESPFEWIIENSITNQVMRLKNESEQNLLLLEQEKDDLLSWIHEVKTPLTAINLMIDRIDDKMLKSQMTYEWLRIHLLLDQQLHQKRIPFIKNDLYIEHTNLEHLIFKEIKTLQSWCMQKGIGFDIDLEVEEVLSDAKWLSFIIRQLLTNAVKYSDSSDIIIKSYQRDEQTMLDVRDFGRGIEQKDLSRIFDKGFTSTTNHQDTSATGMGLYLSKKAAESLKVHIDVQSKLSSGTTFTLIFPKKNEFVNITGM
ncbi:sensor histidine kinase [Cytobacillus solani]|uniref:histidine kinase n=1 Tax=Cytobacillus solani TaxID=1637975 RepID=A0A0Q3QQ15_9BACI|nr:sensor histidine kinase [Cytobacillus solani]KOP82795.1 histidine kinase [Bacillus sp. FJAT-21945]KQL19814.1 histidine kinase [Cytobacillus solani]USK53049.1 sensor histidine kinase [Cytobacillus solani]